MTPPNASAAEAARRLWMRAVGDARSPDDVADAAERMCVQLNAGLGRWIGVRGYQALFHRALLGARGTHPALGDVSRAEGNEEAIANAIRVYGVESVSAGLIALVAMLIELLGRIVGDEMGVKLVEQIAAPSPRGLMSTSSVGGTDGQ